MTGVWQLGVSRAIALDHPRVIAILNLSPDSFFQGGVVRSVSDAAAAAERAISDGADMLDIGGESTRPGAEPVAEAEQVRRVVPAIEAIRRIVNAPISVDTTSAEVARAALDAGADAINDTSAGTDDPAMLGLAAERGCGLILMHRLRRPRDDSYSDRYRVAPQYDDVVLHVKGYLSERASAAKAAGVRPDRIVIDPGLGFGKSVEQNLALIRRTAEFAALGFPVLSAMSRKSFVGRVSGLGESTPEDRLAGSIGLSVAHFLLGARLFRVHDVAPQVRALRAAASLPD